MDERIRVSDADRERVAERLREHFAEGRLTSEELEERITAALTAKTVGDLRRVLTDLPDAAPVSGVAPVRAAGRPASLTARRGGPVRWRPHPLPLLLTAMVAAVLLPGAGALLVIVKFVLLLWLLAIVAAITAIVRLGRRTHRHWHAQDWHGRHWHAQHWHAAYWQGPRWQHQSRPSHHWQGDYSA